jgi:hypothetical protein
MRFQQIAVKKSGKTRWIILKDGNIFLPMY